MERNFKNSKLSFKMVSAGFLYAKGDPSGVADRLFLCGWLVVRSTWENGGFKLEKIVVNAYLTLSVAVNLRCPRVKVQRLV